MTRKVEITFRKTFILRDEQRPEGVIKCYLETMGFEFVSSRELPPDSEVKREQL